MSLTSAVPAGEPLLVHSANPLVPSSARNRREPLKVVRAGGGREGGLGVGVGGTGVDAAAGHGILDHRRVGWRPVALPQLEAVGAVAGPKVDGAAEVGEERWVGAGGSRIDAAARDGI